MADAQSIARRKALAIKEMGEIAERMGGPTIGRRLEAARKKERKNPVLIFQEIAAAWKEIEERYRPDSTPIEDSVEVNPQVLEGLKELGIETKMDLFRTSDAELLRLPGVGVTTLRRLRAQQ